MATVVPHAYAHVQLEWTVPAIGSAVRESPARLTLRFRQRFEPAFATVRVLNSKDQQVNNGDAEVDPFDAKQLSVPLPKLASGTYRVRWRVLSVDTHISEGSFKFDVRP